MSDEATKAAAESIVLFHTECYAMGSDKESERRFIVDATNQIQDVVDDAVVKKDATIAELTADNAAMLEAMRENWIAYTSVDDVCRFCDELVINAPQSPQCNHKPHCILAAEHPGSRLLEEYTQARMKDREAIAHLTGVLEGLRYRVDADCRETIEKILAAYDKAKEKENDNISS